MWQLSECSPLTSGSLAVLSDLMHARCLSWNQWLPWLLFRRHPAYICVLLSEWDVWLGASSVSQGPLSWRNLLICCSPSAAWQLCKSLFKSDLAVLFCFFFFCHCIIGTSQSCRASAWHFCETKSYCVVGLRWHCFLPISYFNCVLSRLYDDSYVPQVSFSSNMSSCETTDVLFSHTTPVYGK